MRYWRRRRVRGDQAVRREWIKGRARDLAQARVTAVRLAAWVIAEQRCPDPTEVEEWLPTLH